MANKQGRPLSKRIGGVALMLLGATLIGYGAHYLTMNGNCSSTGYVSYGPVPKCGAGEGLYITSTFFLGPVVAFTGWGLAQVSGFLWPVTCVCVGTGLATIQLEPGAAPGAKTFGLVGGICFLALAVVSVIVTIRNRLRPRAAPALAAAVGLPTLVEVPRPTAEVPMPTDTAPGGDALDKIARLAHLRDGGALTQEEFEAAKAKLLAEL